MGRNRSGNRGPALARAISLHPRRERVAARSIQVREGAASSWECEISIPSPAVKGAEGGTDILALKQESRIIRYC